MNPIITIKDNLVITNSAAVADVFDKAPRNVVRDIDCLMLKIEQLSISHDLNAPEMFIPVRNEPRRGEGRGKTRAYEMTKPGLPCCLWASPARRHFSSSSATLSSSM